MALFVFIACEDKQGNNAMDGVLNINIEVDNVIKNGIITDISDSVFVIPLQAEPLGVVSDLEVYEDYILLGQRHAGVVDAFNFNGKHISLLNNKGRGVGEYLEIYDVALTHSDSIMAITTLDDIMYYKFPEMNYLYSDKLIPFSSAELSKVNDSVLLLLEDGEYGWALKTIKNRVEKDILLLGYIDEWCSDLQHDLFVHNKDYSTVYKIIDFDSIKSLVRIDFGEQRVNNSYFKKEYYGGIIDDFINNEIIANKKAGFVHFPIISSERVAFMYNFASTLYGDSRMYVHDVASGKSVNYETLSVSGVWPNLTVYGTYKDFFVTLIIPETCIIDEEDELSLDPIVGQMILKEKQGVKKASDIAHPLLVFFRPKV